MHTNMHAAHHTDTYTHMQHMYIGMYAHTHTQTFCIVFFAMIKAVNFAAVACMHSGFAAYVMLVDSGTQK